MNYRKLKSWLISEIGYGTYPLSGNANGAISYGQTNDETSIEALETAFEKGVNFYDTADLYGFGHVETLLGNVFKTRRDKVVFATKGGIVTNDGTQNFSTEHLTECLHASIRRLKTDYVDIYMLHSPKLSELEDGRVMRLLHQFKTDGLVKEFGISLISPDDGIQAITKYGFDIIEVNYNLLDHRAEKNGLFDLCLKQNVYTIVRTPFAQGIFAADFTPNTDKADKRNAWTVEYYLKMKNAALKTFKCINDENYSKAQHSLRFCLSHPATTTVIPGMKTKSEVLENVVAGDAPIMFSSTLKKIDEVYHTIDL